MNRKTLSLLFVLLVIAGIVLFNTMSTSDRIYEAFQNPNAVKCAKLKEQIETMTEVLKTTKPQNDEDRKAKAQLEIEVVSIQNKMKELEC